VQAATKYKLKINLKIAKALGLSDPASNGDRGGKSAI